MNNAPKRRLNVSPSQVKKFETCPRLTAWQLCTKVKPQPGPPDSRALGERAHALVERWLLEGDRPDPTETIEIWRKPKPGELASKFGDEYRVRDQAYVGAIALAHIQTVPPPKHPGLEVEVSATVTTPAATYKARADYRARTFGVSTIGDHKFVGDLSYALTNRPGSVNGFGEPNYLGDDVQAVIQAKAEFEANPDLSCVALAWHYTQTKAVRGEYPTRVVRLTLTREQVDLAMQSIDPVAAQIATVFDLQIQPHALPPRLAASGGCDRIYGRPCEFVSHCNLDPQQKQDQHMDTPITSQQKLADALEKAKKLTAGSFLVGAPTPVAPSAPPAFTVPAFAPPSFAVPVAPRIDASGFDLPAFPLPLGSTFVVPTFAPPAFVAPTLSQNTPPVAPPPHAFSVPPASTEFQAHQALVSEGLENLAKQNPPAFVVPAFPVILNGEFPEGYRDPINPPEAPPNDGTFGPVATAKRVEEVEIPGGDIDALDRAAAKKICVQRGLAPASSRLGVDALRDLIRKNNAGVPIEHVDPSQFVPSVEEIEKAYNEAAAAPLDATREDYREIEAREIFAREVRAALDDLNRVGDRLRALIGA